VTDIVDRLRLINADFLHEEAADEIERLRAERDHWKNYSASQGRALQGGVVIPNEEYAALCAERDRLRNALLIADTACRSYWGWEYGRPGDVDDDDVPDSSLLVKWRRDYEARAKLKGDDQ